MIDSIKVSEVTDVVTPAEETYPENYNFSMESTWEEKILSEDEGGITPTGSIDISENGTYDVTQYASAEVNVPQGVTPSGSQTFTENGTYDVTSLAEAVVNVASSGGITKAEGTFTISYFANDRQLVHNLGTKNIAVVVWMEHDANMEINLPTGGGYTALYLQTVNFDIDSLFNGVTINEQYLDSSKYTTSATYESQSKAPYLMTSGWTNTNASFRNTANNYIKEITDDSVTVSASYFKEGNQYHWIVYDLGSLV